MAFTYTNDPTNDTTDRVRFLLQDTVSTTAILSDEEIAYLLATWTDPVEAARAGAQVIAANFARQADYSKSVGDLSLSETYSSRAAEYREIGQSLADMRMRIDPPAPWANAEALKSTAKREVIDRRTDFYMGQFDNRRP